MAALAKGGRETRLNIFNMQSHSHTPKPGSVHVRVCGVFVPERGKRRKASGFAVQVHDIGQDNTTLQLSAHGAVPVQATHRAFAECVADDHSAQVAQQGAVATGLACVEHIAGREQKDVTLRVGNVTTLLELQRLLPAQGEQRGARGRASCS